MATGCAAEIRIRGTVQGVGLRPTVYQLAVAHGLRGEVYNDGAGVVIRVGGDRAALEAFVAELPLSAPPLARIESLQRRPIAIATLGQDRFQISPSHGGTICTQIAPDAATCPHCLTDSRNPHSRFYRYPFTNCTHCGPRLTIIRALPYDRPATSMAPFAMCPDCQRDYHDPLSRRFHAQPVACPRCGPRLWLEGLGQGGDDPIAAARHLLLAGEIVAIKGIGGIHLACDATNVRAVERLRQGKHRPHKPLALMARDVAVIARYCRISPEERALLESTAAPIVLLRKQTRAEELPAALSPRLPSLGFMLPYSPLHHQLLSPLETPIVLTSGNRVNQPQCIGNDEAMAQLRAITPYYLLHNREIVNRVDDSVVQVINGPQLLRRARGYAPAPLPLPPGFESAPPLLAMGGELKSCFGLGRAGEVMLSQHLGDLENAQALAAYESTLELYQVLFDHQPQAIAADLHPDYLSTQLAQQLGQRWQVPVYGVQHHHAHIAACMVEHGLPMDSPPVLGIALDGLGYGADGGLWGGEFLLADYRQGQRLAHLQPLPLLGGHQAMQQPWRNTYAQLMAALGWQALHRDYGDLELVKFLASKPRPTLDRMLTTQLGSPLASSTGRLFDAVAAAVGCCREGVSYEGQGAMELEGLVPENFAGAGYGFVIAPGAVPILSAAPLWPSLLQDLQRGTDPGIIAARFHYGFAAAIAALAQDLAQRHRLQQVVLSGGVWQNQTLLQAVINKLEHQGLAVLTHHRVPPNDGGLALGQVAIAAAKIRAL
mgnify:CR=1 FL=1